MLRKGNLGETGETTVVEREESNIGPEGNGQAYPEEKIPGAIQLLCLTALGKNSFCASTRRRE